MSSKGKFITLPQTLIYFHCNVQDRSVSDETEKCDPQPNYPCKQKGCIKTIHWDPDDLKEEHTHFM